MFHKSSITFDSFETLPDTTRVEPLPPVCVPYTRSLDPQLVVHPLIQHPISSCTLASQLQWYHTPGLQFNGNLLTHTKTPSRQYALIRQPFSSV